MTLDEAMQQAIRLHQTGRLGAAEGLYRRILEIQPGHPSAMHFLGLACHQRGQREEGIALMSKAAAAEPNHSVFHNNLGNVLAESGRFDEAAAAFQRVLELKPSDADTHNNLGVLNKRRERLDEAEACFRRALELDPAHASAWTNLGTLRSAQGRLEEAVASFSQSLKFKSNNPMARRLLGVTYYSLGRTAEAAEVFRRWLELEPGHPWAEHMLAACTGQGVPERASDAYVEQLFDSFARSFDEQLEQRLAYRAPQAVLDAVVRHCPEPTRQFDVLDAGCGTGLCGPRIAPWARTLEGVDLSVSMLSKAQEKGCYSALHKAEVTTFLSTRHTAYDLVLCVDTLEYFGKLDGVIQAFADSLRPSGWLAFTVEDAAERALTTGYCLNPHGRYAHERNYLERVLKERGLVCLECSPLVLRLEAGMPVAGFLLVAQK